jgi:hypothetical protein
MKATSTQLKSFLRSCKNAYVPMNFGNGEMMIKIIKSDFSNQLSEPEHENSFWEYEMVQASHGIDINIFPVDEVETNVNTSFQEEDNNPVYAADEQVDSFFHE